MRNGVGADPVSALKTVNNLTFLDKPFKVSPFWDACLTQKIFRSHMEGVKPLVGMGPDPYALNALG